MGTIAIKEFVLGPSELYVRAARSLIKIEDANLDQQLIFSKPDELSDARIGPKGNIFIIGNANVYKIPSKKGTPRRRHTLS